MPKASLLFSFACALACLVPARARAEGSPSLSVAGAGACPAAEDVVRELSVLMPDAELEIIADVTDSDVVIADRGNGYTVKVREQRKRFRDLKRNCAERAKHVAVFTVLIVDPLRVPTDAIPAEEEPEPPKNTPEASEPPAPPLTRPEPEPARRAAFDLSLGPLAQVALKGEAESTTQAGGLGLRLRYGMSFGVALGIAGLLPTALHFSEAEARATWAPTDLSLSLSQRIDSWELSLDLGVAAALLLVEGEALDATQQASRLEVGGRAGVQVRYWASSRAGIYGGLSSSWFPKPYSLEVEGIGIVGRTPSAWVGGSLGAVIRL